jgi:pyruvate kinase
MINKTKVIASVGPVTMEKEQIKKLIENGTDVIRVNMSHADYNFCRNISEYVNELNEELHTGVALMMDLTGPEVRIGKFTNGQAFFRKGDRVRIYMDEIDGDDTKFSVSYPNLIKEIKYNSILNIQDGMVRMEVIEILTDFFVCEVLNDATIESCQNLTVEGTKLKLPYLTNKDETNITIAHKLGFDFVSLAYVENAEHVLSVNDLLINMNDEHINILSKIETEEGVDNIDEIIRVSDGIVIARGDLGVSVGMERVPGIQKKIIKKCHEASKVSIISTEIMSSMEKMARPTRAEVSDVANAVLDGADAILLSGETTVGKYPIETLKIVEKVINSAEMDIDYQDYLNDNSTTDITGIIAQNVTSSALKLKCCAIIAPTNSGYTARMMSKFRPSCPVIAVSPNPDTVKSLQLHFAVTPVLIDDLNSLDKIIDLSKEITFKLISTRPGDKIIITGGYPFNEVKYTNFMKIEEL